MRAMIADMKNTVGALFRTGLLLAALALLAACGGAPQAAETPAAPAGEVVQEATGVPQAGDGQDAEPAASAEPTPAAQRGPGDFDLLDPAAGLQDLEGYQAVLKMDFNGTLDGQAYSVSKTYTLTVRRDPPARILVEETSGAAGESPYRLFADLDGVSYRQAAADGPCQASLTNTEDTSPLFHPAALLPRLFGAERTGGETLDGVPAQALSFDARALAAGEGAAAAGQALVAAEGGYVLRYSLQLEGGEAVFGAGAAGKQSWEYTLTPLEGDALAQSLSLPDACPVDRVEFPPLPADARDVVRLPDYRRFYTDMDPAALVASFTEQLGPSGWQPSGGPLETAGGTRQLFTRSAQEKVQPVLLTVKAVDGGFEATLAVLPAQEPAAAPF